MIYICATTEYISFSSKVVSLSYTIFSHSAVNRYDIERKINTWHIDQPISDLIRNYACKIISGPIKNDDGYGGPYCWILESNISIDETPAIDEF
jgi:hypothetical protein